MPHHTSHLSMRTRLAMKLACAPFVGAVHCISKEIRRPARNWQDVIRNDVRLYFAPFIGAINGVQEVWKKRNNQNQTPKQRHRK